MILFAIIYIIVYYCNMINISKESNGLILLQYLFSRGKRIFTTKDALIAAKDINIPVESVNIILSRLTKRKIIYRLKRSLYTSVGLLGELDEIHPFAISAYLVQPCAISHWSALQYHGLTEQIPLIITASTPMRVYTPSMREGHAIKDHLKHAWLINNIRYEYVTIQQKHFELGEKKLGLEKIWIDPHFQIKITDKERTIIDLFAHSKIFGGMYEVLHILENSLSAINIEQLVRYVQLYHVKSVAKRIGWSLEQFGIENKYLQPLVNIQLTSYCLLDPTRTATGLYDTKWMIQNNLEQGSKNGNSEQTTRNKT